MLLQPHRERLESTESFHHGLGRCPNNCFSDTTYKHLGVRKVPWVSLDSSALGPPPLAAPIFLVISQNRGIPIWTPNTIVLIMGTPKRVPRILGNPLLATACRLGVMRQESSRTYDFDSNDAPGSKNSHFRIEPAIAPLLQWEYNPI